MRRLAFAAFLVIALGLAGRSDAQGATQTQAQAVAATVSVNVMRLSTTPHSTEMFRCFKHHGHPWRCLLRFEVEGGHCDLMVSVWRSRGELLPARLHMLTPGCG